ncbi:MAG: Hsp33 family molecular chaperone HslO [Acidaminococcaceae bacterium]|jgi:molecular chaperone Hsp33|nr:Hsp33 family molecular chaperone HslO [Acidaminococcaceae bacterium]
MKDILVKGTIEGVRVYALSTTNLVEKLNRIHKCSPLAIAALGRTVTGALLLAATMKEQECITVQIKGDGPLGTIVAEAQGNFVRGYVQHPEVMLPPKNGKLDVGGGVGQGQILVTRYLAQGEPFTGMCELVNGEIATDLTQYLYQSEQTPASVALGVLVGKDCTVQEAGGYFVQAMPDAKEEVLAQLENNVLTLPYVSELLQAGYTPEDMIKKIGAGLEVNIKESNYLGVKCRCSREKVLHTLAALQDKDLQELSQDAVTEVHCQFCNKSYKFTNTELQVLRDKKST